jgi:ATP-binding cassette subfamily F protein 3
MTLLSITGAAVRFGGVPLFENLGLLVEARERWGIIGRNGCGKTTLMQLILGQRAPDSGSVSKVGGLRIAVMDQYRDFGGAETVWEAAARGFADLFALEHELQIQLDEMSAAGEDVTQAMLDRYSRDVERFEHAGGYAASARVDAVLAGLGFDPVEARTRPIEALSGGERGRLALAGQLAAPADLLILDEPTNHLDIATARWLEGYLRDLDEAVLLISHDRAFLAAVVDHVLHFEGGTATMYDGNYEAFIRQRAERRAALERAVRKQESKIAAEEDFIRRNIAGGNSSQAKGRRKKLARVPRLSAPPGEQGAMSVAFSAGERGGDQVLVVDRLQMTMGERTLLEPWSGILRRGDVVGLVGPNGTGKSTLLKTLLGERRPDGGDVRLMPSMRVAYYKQDLGDVDPQATLFDLIADRRPVWTRGQVQGHLGRFDFSGDSVLRKAGTLSGGERARVALALMMLEHANLLVFDEPTNHLDVESIEALEDAIEGYDGTVLIVSHDRALLENLCTRIWALEDGVLYDFPGGYGEWELDRAARHAAVKDAAKGRVARVVVEPKAPATPSDETRQRRAERSLEAAEAEVTAGEAALAALERRLADPVLYDGTTAAGERARVLVAERDAARVALAEAMARWEALAAALGR